jgi:hypothetical protein
MFRNTVTWGSASSVQELFVNISGVKRLKEGYAGAVNKFDGEKRSGGEGTLRCVGRWECIPGENHSMK